MYIDNSKIKILNKKQYLNINIRKNYITNLLNIENSSYNKILALIATRDLRYNKNYITI